MSVEKLLAYCGMIIIVFIAGIIVGNLITENILHDDCIDRGIVKFDYVYLLCKEIYSTNADVVQ